MIPPERAQELLQQLSPYMAMVTETQVLDFSSRAGYGPYLKMRLADPEQLRGFEQGQQYHMILIRIGDDSMPAAADPEKRKPYKLSQQAGYLCNQPEFWAFVKHTSGEACNDKEDAARWLREICGVESRSFLDSNPDAAETFKRIDKEYQEYKQGQG